MAKATSSTIEKKFLTLKSSDGDEFELEESIAIQSVTIKNMVEDGCSSSVIPLSNVDTETLIKIIDYLKMHSLTSSNEEEIENFNREFVSIGFKTIFKILEAANFLDINSLLELCAEAVANRIKNKTPEAVRKIFNITNDFTPEEEAEIRNETPWAFEGDLDQSLD
ncbi:PREDICTED: SKP1-like protein 11 [Nicotiana attenuata]|uniref:SKP1-like protein n=1 Tax=Nicotiana attenuata TaxID=49451 RepID=A0A1J6KJA3_NICAT|nr:PREDICTED: SKP1-like protein 11 [Nicotiana attenuata]OIT21911.1 skp1-like protein 11 [Nicotiana attenuata]